MDSHDSETSSAEMSTRRRWLTLCAGTSAALVAGCLGDDDDEEVADDTDDPAEDDSADEEPADNEEEADEPTESETDEEDDLTDEQYQEALDELIASAELFDSLAEEDRDATEDDIETLENNLERAESNLADATAQAPDDLQAEIDAAHEIVDFHRELVEYYRISVKLDSQMETAFSYWEIDEPGNAQEAFGTTREIIQEGIDQLGQIQDTRENLPHGSIDVDQLDYSDEIFEYVQPDSFTELELFDEFIAGVEQFTRTLELTVLGEEAFNEGEFTEAREQFEAAKAEAETGAETMTGLEDNPDFSDDLRPQIIAFRGELGQWIDALEYFVDAAETGEKGDIQRAEELYNEGLEQLS